MEVSCGHRHPAADYIYLLNCDCERGTEMYKLGEYVGVVRLTDNTHIPACPDNRDWREYLEWRAKGNEPLPAYTPAELAEKQKAEDEAARERLIAEKTRELAVAELKREGKLPTDYRLNQK